MAWSPQARAAAAAARKRKGHTTSARHVNAKYTVTAKHPGKHSQFKAKAKKVAKYTAVAGAVGAAAVAYNHGNKPNVRANRIANHTDKARLARKMSRKLPYTHPVSKRLSKTAMYHQGQALKLQKKGYKARKKAKR